MSDGEKTWQQPKNLFHHIINPVATPCILRSKSIYLQDLSRCPEVAEQNTGFQRQVGFMAPPTVVYPF